MSEAPIKLVNAKHLVALLKDADNKKTRIASINGEIGERIKEAVENGNLHKGLFGLMLKLSRQDEQKREEFIGQFQAYVDMCREHGVFGQEHVGDLLDSEPEEDPDDVAAKANAEAIEKGITPIPEDDFEDDAKSAKPSRRRKGVSGDAPASYRIQ
jgi:hypothetical protein